MCIRDSGGIERHRAAFAARAGHADDGLGAVLFADALVVLLHDGERLVPRALFPRLRVAAVGAGALERGQDARRAVHVVLEGDAPGAQAVSYTHLSFLRGAPTHEIVLRQCRFLRKRDVLQLSFNPYVYVTCHKAQPSFESRAEGGEMCIRDRPRGAT